MCNGTAATSSRTLSVLLAPQGFRLLLLRLEMEKTLNPRPKTLNPKPKTQTQASKHEARSETFGPEI